MCETVGLKVIGLKRIRIGKVTLGNLPAGQWRYLSPNENFLTPKKNTPHHLLDNFHYLPQ